MRSLLLTLSAFALSSSVAFAQTPPAPPPPGTDAPTAGESATPPPPPNPDEDDAMVDGSEGGPAMHDRRGGPDRMGRHGGPRHHMRGEGQRGGPGWRSMRRAQGSEFKIEIDEDGGVKIEVKCGPREEARACADMTMELLDRVNSN